MSSVSIDDIMTASERICTHIRETPLLEEPLLNRALGFRLLVKAEGLQITGAFKVRGAMNNALQLTKEEKERGVFATSAGNHALGLAYAAQQVETHAMILMPHNAPKLKVNGTKAFGAAVVTYNRLTENRDEIGLRICKENGLRWVHSYNDHRTIAGQGTIGLEIHRQSQVLGASPDAIIVNCSGGGLTSGITLTGDLYAKRPRIYTAEPEGFDDARRSLQSGVISTNNATDGSICDALLIPRLGELTFPILKKHKVKGFAASDQEVQAAISLGAEKFKLVLEAGGAVSLAAAIKHRELFKGQTVIVVASGSNVDRADYAKYLRTGNVLRKKLWGPAL